jgi:hypothetical protein
MPPFSIRETLHGLCGRLELQAHAMLARSTERASEKNGSRLKPYAVLKTWSARQTSIQPEPCTNHEHTAHQKMLLDTLGDSPRFCAAGGLY